MSPRKVCTSQKSGLVVPLVVAEAVLQVQLADGLDSHCSDYRDWYDCSLELVSLAVEVVYNSVNVPPSFAAPPRAMIARIQAGDLVGAELRCHEMNSWPVDVVGAEVRTSCGFVGVRLKWFGEEAQECNAFLFPWL